MVTIVAREKSHTLETVGSKALETSMSNITDTHLASDAINRSFVVRPKTRLELTQQSVILDIRIDLSLDNFSMAMDRAGNILIRQ
jgi:hypothetical protein